MGSALRISVFLAFFAYLLGASYAFADYRMCALRKGASGPCTCQSDKDPPGQFTVVKKSYCRRAATIAVKPKKTPEVKETSQGDNSVEPSSGEEAAALPEGTTDQHAGAQTPPAAEAAEDNPSSSETQSVEVVEETTASISKLGAVKARGKLLCGVNKSLLGFSSQSESGVWSGIDADFCRAIAAAIFADGSKVEFISLETNERFDALQSGKVDVLSRNTTWTMNREIDLGLRFAGVLYFDGQGFMVRDSRGLVSAQQVSGLKVCVESGTTSEANMNYYFKAHQIQTDVKTYSTHDEIVKAYDTGECDVYSGDRSALFADRLSFSEPTQHTILPEVISKEPLGPLVLKSDDEWAAIMRWTLAALINAEEVGLDRASAAADQPVSDYAQRLIDGAGVSGEKLNLNKMWLRNVVASVGNYGEMFEANLGKSSPLGMNRGLNALWKRGGILYAPPMW